MDFFDPAIQTVGSELGSPIEFPSIVDQKQQDWYSKVDCSGSKQVGEQAGSVKAEVMHGRLFSVILLRHWLELNNWLVWRLHSHPGGR